MTASGTVQRRTRRRTTSGYPTAATANEIAAGSGTISCASCRWSTTQSSAAFDRAYSIRECHSIRDAKEHDPRRSRHRPHRRQPGGTGYFQTTRRSGQRLEEGHRTRNRRAFGGPRRHRSRPYPGRASAIHHPTRPDRTQSRNCWSQRSNTTNVPRFPIRRSGRCRHRRNR